METISCDNTNTCAIISETNNNNRSTTTPNCTTTKTTTDYSNRNECNNSSIRNTTTRTTTTAIDGRTCGGDGGVNDDTDTENKMTIDTKTLTNHQHNNNNNNNNNNDRIHNNHLENKISTTTTKTIKTINEYDGGCSLLSGQYQFVLAPMVRGTECAYRMFIRSYQVVSICYTPMIRASCIVSGYQKYIGYIRNELQKQVQQQQQSKLDSRLIQKEKQQQLQHTSFDATRNREVTVTSAAENGCSTTTTTTTTTNVPQQDEEVSSHLFLSSLSSCSNSSKLLVPPPLQQLQKTYKDDEILFLYDSCCHDTPLIVQICGHDPMECYIATQCILFYYYYVHQNLVYGIDLNLGCPQICAKKELFGIYLLEHDINLVIECLSSMKQAIKDTMKIIFDNETTKPIQQQQKQQHKVHLSCKIRLLENTTISDMIEITKRIQTDGQCDFITLHCRSKQMKQHDGEPNLHAWYKIQQALSIPVWYNGTHKNNQNILQQQQQQQQQQQREQQSHHEENESYHDQMDSEMTQPTIRPFYTFETLPTCIELLKKCSSISNSNGTTNTSPSTSTFVDTTTIPTPATTTNTTTRIPTTIMVARELLKNPRFLSVHDFKYNNNNNYNNNHHVDSSVYYHPALYAFEYLQLIQQSSSFIPIPSYHFLQTHFKWFFRSYLLVKKQEDEEQDDDDDDDQENHDSDDNNNNNHNNEQQQQHPCNNTSTAIKPETQTSVDIIENEEIEKDHNNFATMKGEHNDHDDDDNDTTGVYYQNWRHRFWHFLSRPYLREIEQFQQLIVLYLSFVLKDHEHHHHQQQQSDEKDERREVYTLLPEPLQGLWKQYTIHGTIPTYRSIRRNDWECIQKHSQTNSTFHDDDEDNQDEEEGYGLSCLF